MSECFRVTVTMKFKPLFDTKKTKFCDSYYD